jgi:hypothetical protein
VRPAGPLRLHQDSHAARPTVAEKILASFTTCPIPEVARLGRTLKQWRSEFLGYFDTNGASNGAQRPSMGSSSSTGASPAASETATTIASECCSSPKGYTHNPHSTAKSRIGTPQQKRLKGLARRLLP